MIERADLRELTFASHSYPNFHLLMPVWTCTSWDGDPSGAEGQELRWCDADELERLPMPEADVPLLPAVRLALGGMR